jgi:hypothetical protein
MADDNQILVAFPASSEFTRVGRVAAVGLALRLGFDVAQVEQLRKAVDQSVTALQGPGRIETEARWTDGWLTVLLHNDEAELSGAEATPLVAGLEALVDEVTVEGGRIELRIADRA